MHKLKLIVLLAIFVVACAFGVRSGCMADAETVLKTRLGFSLLVGGEERSTVGFFFLTLLEYALCFAAVIATSFNVWLGVVSVSVFFYTSYMAGYTVSVYFVYFKLAALPYLLICFIPHVLLTVFSVACLIAVAFDCALEFRRCGCIHSEGFMRRLPKFAFCGCIAVIGVVYGGLLGGLLTLGLIV